MFDRGVAEKLAKYVAQSNGEMEAAVRERQRGNPQFAFLFGGEGADYYRDCLRKFSAERAPEASAPAAGSGSQPAVPLPRADPPVVPPRSPGGGAGDGRFSRAPPPASADGANGGVSAGGRGRGEPRRPSRPPAPAAPPPIPAPPPPPAPLPPPPAAPAATATADPNANGEMSRILDLLERRDAHRARREWAQADRLKEELFALNVVMDDREKTWCIKPAQQTGSTPGVEGGGGGAGGAAGGVGAGGGAGRSVSPTRRRNGPVPAASPPDRREGHSKHDGYSRSEDHSRHGNYSRQEDHSRHGDYSRDKDHSRPEDHFRPGVPSRHDYSRAPGDSVRLSSADEARIHAGIARRLSAKVAREFDKADAVSDRRMGKGKGIDGVEKGSAGCGPTLPETLSSPSSIVLAPPLRPTSAPSI
jgi:hypothetical protein